MRFNVFKEIFDLDPKEVEEFIRNQIKNKYKFKTVEEKEQWWKDFTLEVKWYPSCNNFYVYTEPNLEYTNDKPVKITFKGRKQFPYSKKWSGHHTFKGREITLDEYLYHQFDHYHFNFYEIYGLMTGKTEVWRVWDNRNGEDEIELSYDGVYNKEYVDIIKIRNGYWHLREWEEGELVTDEYGETYHETIEKRVPVPKDLLDYVIALDPDEVSLR